MTPETRAARDRLARYARPDFPMPAPDLPDALGPFTAAQLNRVTDELMRGVQETLAPDIRAVLAALDMPCPLTTCEHILTEQAAEDLKQRFLAAQHDGTPIRVLDDTDATEWGKPETQWTLGVRRPDGSCFVETHLEPEADVRRRFEEMVDSKGYRKALLRREASAWTEQHPKGDQ